MKRDVEEKPDSLGILRWKPPGLISKLRSQLPCETIEPGNPGLSDQRMEQAYNGNYFSCIWGDVYPDIKAQIQMLIIGPGGEMTESEIEECITHMATKINGVCPPA